MFLAFQYPTAIPGLCVASFLRTALNAKRQGVDKDPDVDPTDPIAWRHQAWASSATLMREKMALLKMDDSFASALRQRGLLGRREEAPGDAPDGRARAADRHPRRDRLGPRHRRAADRRRGRQRAAQPRAGRAADHPLPAHAQLHQARRRPRPGAGPDRRSVARTSRSGSRTRATPRSCARRASRSTSPTRRCNCRPSRPRSRPRWPSRPSP